MSDGSPFQLRHLLKGKSVVVTIEFPDGATHTDQIEITKFRVREEFLADVCRDREGFPVGELRKKLEEVAATTGTSTQEGSDSDEAEGAASDGSLAARLVSMAEKEYRLGRTQQNEVFAVPIDGSCVIRPLRDSGAASLRAELAKKLWAREKQVANASSLTDALQVLEGAGMEAAPEDVFLRVARHDENIVLDLGDEQGHVAVITPKGWQVTTDSPVLFRRTQLSGALPLPEPNGSLDELMDMINVSHESRPLILGYLVAALIPEIKHPIGLMGGLKGAGKSTAAEALARVIDPGPAMLRTPPREVEEWALNASSSWIIVIDNISRIPEWLSDALCRAATGDGLVRRRLFSSEQLSVLSFLRVVMLTSIDAGALKGDLGDRVLLIDLEPIPKRSRRSESKFWDKYRKAQPRIMGALLDLMVKVLRVLPGVQPAELERMADFHRLLIAVDQVRGTNAADIYVRQRTRVAEEVVEGDPVAQAVMQFVQREREWKGTSQKLLERITPVKVPKGWPQGPRALSGCLRRLVSVLAELGVEVVPPVDTNRGGGKDRDRLYRLRLLNKEEEATVLTARPSENGSAEPLGADPGRTVLLDGGTGRASAADSGNPTAEEVGRSDCTDGPLADPHEDAAEPAASCTIAGNDAPCHAVEVIR